MASNATPAPAGWRQAPLGDACEQEACSKCSKPFELEPTGFFSAALSRWVCSAICAKAFEVSAVQVGLGMYLGAPSRR